MLGLSSCAVFTQTHYTPSTYTLSTSPMANSIIEATEESGIGLEVEVPSENYIAAYAMVEPVLHESNVEVNYYSEVEVYYQNYETYNSTYIERFIVAIDPGHQGRGNYDREPLGPGASEYKAKVASGTRGVVTGVPEFQLVLDVSLVLRDELLSRGFDVFMIRKVNDVNISNRERAIMATEAEADVFIRVHANGSSNRDAHGIMTLSHSRNNPFIPELYELSRSLSEHILFAMVEETSARNLGVIEVDNMTGTNWATMPVTIVEMGFMTNLTEDTLMQTVEYQNKLVTGMANGIENYFAEHFGRYLSFENVEIE